MAVVWSLNKFSSTNVSPEELLDELKPPAAQEQERRLEEGAKKT
jgi:hypothetical protein